MKPQDARPAAEGPCTRRRLVFALLWVLSMTLLTGCAPNRLTTGAFTQVARIDSELERGVSTKEDVQRILGPPKGGGSAIVPPDRGLREVWFYDDIELLNVTSPKPGIMKMDVRQQILLVFFQEGVFDGFMWFSNAAKTKAEEM